MWGGKAQKGQMRTSLRQDEMKSGSKPPVCCHPGEVPLWQECCISSQCWLCLKPHLPCSLLFYKRGAEEPPMWDCLNQTMPWELEAPVHLPHGFPPVVPWVSQSGCWCLLVIEQPQVPSSNSEKRWKTGNKRPLKRYLFSKYVTKAFHTLWVSHYQNTCSHLNT